MIQQVEVLYTSSWINCLNCKVLYIKPFKTRVYTFPVTQLVKSTKDNMRLDMLVLDDEKKKKQTKFTFAFTSVHVRETFCQQIMQMKNMHSSAVEVDQISVFVGTWNMGKKKMT